MYCKAVILSAFLGSAISAPQYVYDTPDLPALLYEAPHDSSESYTDPATLYETPIDSEESEIPSKPASLYETPIYSSKAEAQVIPTFLSETSIDSKEFESPTVPTSLFETPRESKESEVPSIPTSLYETPGDSKESNVPPVPTSLYETPGDSSEVEAPAVLTSSYQTAVDSREYESSSEIQELKVQYQIPSDSAEKLSSLYQLPRNSAEDDGINEKEDGSNGSSYKEEEIMENKLPTEPEIFDETPVDGEDVDIYGYSSENSSEDSPYDFEWAIEDSESGNSFSHVESRDGRTMQGQYRVLLPDGRTQVVSFYDDGNGYHADVSYER